MSDLFKFESWEFLNEVRRPRKCPIVDFRPLFKTLNYKDILSLGGREVSPGQGKKQGNLRFDHPDFHMTIRLNLNGAIWEDARREEAPNLGAEALEFDPEAELYAQAPLQNRDGKAIQIFPTMYESEKYFQPCLTIEDFDLRLEFIIKRILEKKGLISREEARSDEAPNVILLRKMADDADFFLELTESNALPASLGAKGTNIIGILKGLLDKATLMDYELIIRTLTEGNENLPKLLKEEGFDMAKAKKLSTRYRLLQRG